MHIFRGTARYLRSAGATNIQINVLFKHTSNKIKCENQIRIISEYMRDSKSLYNRSTRIRETSDSGTERVPKLAAFGYQ